LLHLVVNIQTKIAFSVKEGKFKFLEIVFVIHELLFPNFSDFK